MACFYKFNTNLCRHFITAVIAALKTCRYYNSGKKAESMVKSDYSSSRSHLFFKIGVLKNFAIFTEKHLCWSQHRCFPLKFVKFLILSFSKENLLWLL